MRSRALIALTTLLAATALTGCTAGSSTPTETVTVTAPAPVTSDAPAATESAEDAPSADVTFVTVVDNDAKTILGLDAAGITALTGSAPADARPALADAETWRAQPETAEYADLIAAAVAQETGSVTGGLRAVENDSHALFQVIIIHTQGTTEAHIGVGGN